MATVCISKPVVVGAGPAGATAALALAARGIPCLLLDKAPFPRDKVCGDAFSGKVVEALNKIDRSLAPQIQSTAEQHPAWGVSFFAPNGKRLDVPFRTDYCPTDTAPGFVAKRVVFDTWLFKQAAANPMVEVRTGAGVKTAQQTPDGIRLDYPDGTALLAPVVLAADGATGPLNRALAQDRPPLRHRSAGLRQYWAGVTGLHPDGFIELHFLKRTLPGYVWVFPLPNGHANVGIGVRSDVVAKRRLNVKALLAEALAAPPFKDRFSKAQALEKPQGCPLPMGSRTRTLHGDGFLLLGDAASLIDPFTGEGIGNAMLSGILAAECVANAHGNYSAAQLAPYTAGVHQRLASELRVGSGLQRLAQYPRLFNLVVNRARRSAHLRELLTAMFEDVDLRGRLRNPAFYFRILFR